MSPQMILPELIKGSYGFQNEKIKWSVSLHCFQFSLIPPKQEKGWDSSLEMIGVKIPSWIRNLIYTVSFCQWNLAHFTPQHAHAWTCSLIHPFPPAHIVFHRGPSATNPTLLAQRVCAFGEFMPGWAFRKLNSHTYTLAHTHWTLCQLVRRSWADTIDKGRGVVLHSLLCLAIPPLCGMTNMLDRIFP